jgi:Uma2 family endonuclease
MSTATTHPTTAAPSPLEVPRGPIAIVPSLGELERLTAIPERRVVFRDVDWLFYEQLVDSIPESSPIHVDYDGKDLEVMGKNRKHGKFLDLLGHFVIVITDEFAIPYSSTADTTWKRQEILRGLEADKSYYFLPEKLAADADALKRGSDDIADYPNPDLAIEIDISPPQVDRAAIYAALRVTEVWRFDGDEVIIERLNAEGTYTAVEASGFLPVRTKDLQRWLVEEDARDECAWAQRLRAEIRSRTQS